MTGDLILEKGKLIPLKSDLCAGIGKRQFFDSKSWQIVSPIFYFSGSKDPATPVSNGRYHFDSKKYGDKYWFQVEGSGHNALTGNLDDCSGKILRTIGNGIYQSLPDVIKECRLAKHVQMGSVEKNRLDFCNAL